MTDTKVVIDGVKVERLKSINIEVKLWKQFVTIEEYNPYIIAGVCEACDVVTRRLEASSIRVDQDVAEIHIDTVRKGEFVREHMNIPWSTRS